SGILQVVCRVARLGKVARPRRPASMATGICGIHLLALPGQSTDASTRRRRREKRGCMNTTTNRLLWDENGQIGCELPSHAPYKGSDTWRSGRWRAITPVEAEAFEREVGRAPECETCASIARRAQGDAS